MHVTAQGTRRANARKPWLEAAGYPVVRMAGRHGLYDLIGISATDILRVQGHSRNGPSRAAQDAIAAFSIPLPCRKRMHHERDGQRQPHIWEL
jgi:hypothetical protein